ncbi:hypothetical protein D4764_08G0006400, partial [Takifugu flavidus]
KPFRGYNAASTGQSWLWKPLGLKAWYACTVEWMMCGSCGWLSPVSLPVKSAAKRNVFFTGFGCQMLRIQIMDQPAGGKTERWRGQLRTVVGLWITMQIIKL